MVTSEYSIGRAPSALSMVRDTCARPSAERAEVPAKMTSSILPPRRDLAPCSPMTHARASTTLDLPEPLGPTTAVTPGSKWNVVAEAKDLKPRTVRVFKCTRGISWVWRSALREAVKGWAPILPGVRSDRSGAAVPPGAGPHPGTAGRTRRAPRGTCQTGPLDWAGPARLFTRAPRSITHDRFLDGTGGV